MNFKNLLPVVAILSMLGAPASFAKHGWGNPSTGGLPPGQAKKLGLWVPPGQAKKMYGHGNYRPGAGIQYGQGAGYHHNYPVVNHQHSYPIVNHQQNYPVVNHHHNHQSGMNGMPYIAPAQPNFNHHATANNHYNPYPNHGSMPVPQGHGMTPYNGAPHNSNLGAGGRHH